MSHNEYAQQMAYDKEQGGAAEMLTIPWVAKNAELIDFSKEAIDRSNEPDTEPESDTDYDTDDLPSDSEEEEKDCCCVGCNIKVCGYDEEPPHKDSRDEAVCNDCWEEEEDETIGEDCIVKNVNLNLSK